MSTGTFASLTLHFGRSQYILIFVISVYKSNLGPRFIITLNGNVDTKMSFPELDFHKYNAILKWWWIQKLSKYVKSSDGSRITSVTLDLRNCNSDSTTCTLLLQSELQGISPTPNWFFGTSLGLQPARLCAAWTSWQSHSFFSVWHLQRTVTL